MACSHAKLEARNVEKAQDLLPCLCSFFFLSGLSSFAMYYSSDGNRPVNILSPGGGAVLGVCETWGQPNLSAAGTTTL